MDEGEFLLLDPLPEEPPAGYRVAQNTHGVTQHDLQQSEQVGNVSSHPEYSRKTTTTSSIKYLESEHQQCWKSLVSNSFFFFFCHI